MVFLSWLDKIDEIIHLDALFKVVLEVTSNISIWLRKRIGVCDEAVVLELQLHYNEECMCHELRKDFRNFSNRTTAMFDNEGFSGFSRDQLETSIQINEFLFIGVEKDIAAAKFIA